MITKKYLPLLIFFIISSLLIANTRANAFNDHYAEVEKSPEGSKIDQLNSFVNKSSTMNAAPLSLPASDNEPQLWFRADSGVYLFTDDQIVWWLDHIDSSILSPSGTSYYRPSLIENAYNFNPTVRFDGSDRMTKTISNTLINSKTNTCFIVQKYKSGMVVFSMSQIGYGSPFRRFSFEVNNGKPRFDFPNDQTNDGKLVGTQDITDKFGMFNFNSESKENKILINSVEHVVQKRYSSLVTGQETYSFALGTSNQFQTLYAETDISEFIFFNTQLSATDLRSWSSYLGIKYGLTLGENGANYAYTNSSHQTIWSADPTFHNDVTGIGFDSNWDLNQTISRSHNTDLSESCSTTLATIDDFEESNDFVDRIALNDGQFLVWGHNNSDYDTWQANGAYKTIDRKWKVNNTGNVSTLYLQLNLDNLPTPDSGMSYQLLLDSDNDLANGLSTVYDLTQVFGTNLYTTSIQFPDGVSYFSIGFESENIDYGDAPDSYSTLEASNGASHQIVSGIHLGNGISGDTDGFGNGVDQNQNASDDTHDDGVTFNPLLGISSHQILQAGLDNVIRINASAAGYISAWLDVNMDGDFNDANELLYNNISVVQGDNDFNFDLSSKAKHGVTYARFRYYTASGLGNSPVGHVEGGEVEDYQVFITSLKPDDECSNLLVNGDFEMNMVSYYNIFDQKYVDGWNSSSNYVEIWKNTAIDGIHSLYGNQLSELNANGPTTYYQDVITTPGTILNWAISHRARSGSDQLQLKLGAPDQTTDVQTITTNTTWQTYSGNYYVPPAQYVTRFEIATVAPVSSSGNLIDHLYFGQQPIQISLADYSNISCNGDSDGMLMVQAQGGNGGYNYQWSNGSLKKHLSDIPSGEYTITITSGGCTQDQSFYLYNPDMAIITSEIHAPECDDSTNGTIDLSVTLPSMNCLSFDGTDDYVALAKSFDSENALPKFTACSWIKVESGKGGKSIIDFDNSEYFSIATGGSLDNYIHFETHSEAHNSTHTLVGTTDVCDNQWHHVVCIYDGENKRIYIDGAFDSGTTVPIHGGMAVGSNQTRFGFIGDGSEATTENGNRKQSYFEGMVAMVELFDRVLILQEIEARMHSCELAEGLIQQCRINEGSGTTITAAAGENGETHGNPTWMTDDHFSPLTYSWTGEDGFTATTEDIAGLYIGSYTVLVTLPNSCSVTATVLLAALHHNILTNTIQFE